MPVCGVHCRVMRAAPKSTPPARHRHPDIAFARISPWTPPARRSDQAATLTFVYAGMLCGLPLVWAINALRPHLPPGSPIAIWWAILPIAFFAILIIRRRRGRDSTPKSADASCRIHALHFTRLLDRFEPLRDEVFEPESVQAPIPTPERWWEWLGVLVLAVTGFILAGLIPILRSPPLAMGAAGAMGTLGLAALGVWRQTWYRFSPGRLDVLVFRPWSDRAFRSRCYDLRTPRILIDLRWRRMVLDGDGTRETIPLGGIWAMDRAAYLILRAAISTAPTPPVPADRLDD